MSDQRKNSIKLALVKRFNGIEADPDGVYVMFEDYERLTTELELTNDLGKTISSQLDEIERLENLMREIQAATSNKAVLAITDRALCDD